MLSSSGNSFEFKYSFPLRPKPFIREPPGELSFSQEGRNVESVMQLLFENNNPNNNNNNNENINEDYHSTAHLGHATNTTNNNKSSTIHTIINYDDECNKENITKLEGTENGQKKGEINIRQSNWLITTNGEEGEEEQQEIIEEEETLEARRVEEELKNKIAHSELQNKPINAIFDVDNIIITEGLIQNNNSEMKKDIKESSELINTFENNEFNNCMFNFSENTDIINIVTEPNDGDGESNSNNTENTESESSTFFINSNITSEETEKTEKALPLEGNANTSIDINNDTSFHYCSSTLQQQIQQYKKQLEEHKCFLQKTEIKSDSNSEDSNSAEINEIEDIASDDNSNTCPGISNNENSNSVDPYDHFTDDNTAASISATTNYPDTLELNENESYSQIVARARDALDIESKTVNTTNIRGFNFIDITPFMALPQAEAAKKLGMPPSTLSKRWRVAARKKWPWRAVSKIDKEIKTLLKELNDDENVPAPIAKRLSYLLKKREKELIPVRIRI